MTNADATGRQTILEARLAMEEEAFAKVDNDASNAHIPFMAARDAYRQAQRQREIVRDLITQTKLELSDLAKE